VSVAGPIPCPQKALRPHILSSRDTQMKEKKTAEERRQDYRDQKARAKLRRWRRENKRIE